ncbi:uncharacterized protein AC631_02805 [Debaryomyces fabryi]|uniref:Major facilitator superfamily (MFS) profile domain-containing protein n=1 Tax=Debaryomyces fabryi TaxID=58627 RepID=A0A0V1PZ59_9ASCO|nr:uncharacterized protein AC631_02805 [Debaryomyces fabryi]KSA01442.1 hypothetical protein AC631_02805 [Debaryomyces fabryi]
MDRPVEDLPLLSKGTKPMNPNDIANLEHAVNDVYEALVDDDDDYELDEDAVWLREQRDLNKTTHWLKRPSVLMIGVPLFFFALAFSSGDSTRRMITFKLACNYLSGMSKEGKCDPIGTQLLVSNLYLTYSILVAVVTMFVQGKIGKLSDQYGRKPFLILILAVFLIARIFKFYVMYSHEYLRFGLMVATEIAGNLTGGSISLISLTNCYIADVVEPHQRIYSLGLGIACLFVGLSIGPILGNALLSLPELVHTNKETILDINMYMDISEREYLPLKFEIVAVFLVLMFIVFVMPESRSEKARSKSRAGSLSRSSLSVDVRPLDIELDQPSILTRVVSAINFLKPLKLLLLPNEVAPTLDPAKLRRMRIVIVILVTVDCMLTAIGISLMEIYVLFGIYKFNWRSIEIGHSLAIACSSRAVILIILSPVITHKLLQKGLRFKVLKNQFDMVDFSVCVLGFVFESIGLVVLSLAPSTTWFLIGMTLMSFGALASPSLNSAIIKFYPESKIGELFGATSLLKNIFTLAGPVTFLSIYKTSLARWNAPGAVFLVCSLLMLLCSISIFVVKKLLNLDRNTTPSLTRRSSSIASSSTNLNERLALQGLLENSDSNDDPLNRKPSIADSHRKKSFVQIQRSIPQ